MAQTTTLAGRPDLNTKYWWLQIVLGLFGLTLGNQLRKARKSKLFPFGNEFIN